MARRASEHLWGRMTVQLFRQEVIEAGRERLAGTVVAAVPPRAKLYVGLVLGFAALVAAILVFGHYSSRAQVKGVVAYDSRYRPGLSRHAGRDPRLPRPQRPACRGGHAARHPRHRAGRRRPHQPIGPARRPGRRSWRASRSSPPASAAPRPPRSTKQKASLAADIASLERQRVFAAGQARLAESATAARRPPRRRGRRHPAPGRGQPLGPARPPRRDRATGRAADRAAPGAGPDRRPDRAAAARGRAQPSDLAAQRAALGRAADRA